MTFIRIDVGGLDRVAGSQRAHDRGTARRGGRAAALASEHGDLYRSKVDELAAALQREDTRLEASEIAGPFDRGSIARGHRILPVRDGIRQGFSFDWFR